jgi:hypothetical protein
MFVDSLSFVTLLLCLSVVICVEDIRPSSEHKPGDYVETINPGCAPGECVGVAQLYFLMEHSDPTDLQTTKIFRQSYQAFISWVRRANSLGGLSLKDGSKKKVLFKSYYLTEPIGNFFLHIERVCGNGNDK